MTEQQIMAVIKSMTVPAGEPESYPGGISRRSWLYRQRDGAAGDSGPANPRGAEESWACLRPLGIALVYAESPEVIAGMPELTEKQQELFDQLRLVKEEPVVLGGRGRKTVECVRQAGHRDLRSRVRLE